MCENKERLCQKANAFCEFIIDNSINATYREDLITDKFAKISLYEAGKIVIYCSKKKGFTFVDTELKGESIKARCRELWEKFNQLQSTNCESEDLTNNYSIYVDGSYLREYVGYGMAVIKDNTLIYENFGGIVDKSIVAQRQIGGEINAVLVALNWCKANGIKTIEIFYDYLGLENWPTNRWKAKNKLTKEYAEKVMEADVTIHWHKVDSHTNDYWNDYVDSLAKKGASSMIGYQKIDSIDKNKSLARESDNDEKIKKYLTLNRVKFIEEPKHEFLTKFKVKESGEHKGFICLDKNTRGKTTLPRFEGTLSYKIKDDITQLFKRNVSIIKTNPLGKFEYYYQILKKYKSYNFDFSILASELNTLAAEIDIIGILPQSSFEEIELLYNKIKEYHHAEFK